MPNKDSEGNMLEPPMLRADYSPRCRCLYCQTITKLAKTEDKVDLFYDDRGWIKEGLMDRLTGPYGYALWRTMQIKGLLNGRKSEAQAVEE